MKQPHTISSFNRDDIFLSRTNSPWLKTILWSLLTLLLIMMSCKKTDHLTEQPPPQNDYVRFKSATVQVSSVAGPVKAIAIESNTNWKITLPSPAADWFELNKTTGQGNDSIRIKITKDNLAGTKRTAAITASLSNGQSAVQLNIEQEAAPNNNLTILWKKMFGGNGNDYPYGIVNAPDGGQVVAGRTSSNGTGDVAPTHGGTDFWIVKTNNDGQIAWQKTFGGSSNDEASSIAVTPDGGYVISGFTLSNNTGDVGTNHGGVDYWVIKLNGSGALQWQKTLGGDKDDFPNAITVTSEGAIIVAGYTKSNNTGDVGANHGNEDYWIVKLDNNTGNVGWKKVLGGNGTEKAKAITATNDGGIIVGGSASSDNNGDVPATKGADDFWIVRLDKDGHIVWKNTFGGLSLEQLNGITTGPNSTVVAVGTATSKSNGDVGTNNGGEDYWVVQLNATTGTLNWQKTLGGSASDIAKCVVTTANGNIIVGGYTYSDNTGDVENTMGGADFWVVEFTSNGTVNWKKLIGGTDEEQLFGIAVATDNSYVVTGNTYSSNSGEAGQNHGGGDYWIIKLKE